MAPHVFWRAVYGESKNKGTVCQILFLQTCFLSLRRVGVDRQSPAEISQKTRGCGWLWGGGYPPTQTQTPKFFYRSNKYKYQYYPRPQRSCADLPRDVPQEFLIRQLQTLLLTGTPHLARLDRPGRFIGLESRTFPKRSAENLSKQLADWSSISDCHVSSNKRQIYLFVLVFAVNLGRQVDISGSEVT